MKTPAGRNEGRGKILQTALRACIVLRRGRWTMHELADELAIKWRTAYRVVADLRAAGVTVEVSEERDGRAVMRHYSIPGEPLLRLLGLLPVRAPKTKEVSSTARWCSDCGRPVVPGRSRCAADLERVKVYSRKRRAAMAARLRCVCGRRLAIGNKKCRVCLDRDNLQRHAQLRERQAAGQCSRCEQPALAGLRFCGLHREDIRWYNATEARRRGRRVFACRRCGRQGHNARTCPDA